MGESPAHLASIAGVDLDPNLTSARTNLGMMWQLALDIWAMLESLLLNRDWREKLSELSAQRADFLIAQRTSRVSG